MVPSGDWPRRGEIWWVRTPDQPDDPHQPRPVIILSVDARNMRTGDVIVVPVFSSGQLGPNRVRIPRSSGGLPHDSIAFCDELATIQHRSLTNGPMGRPLPPHLLDQLVAAVLVSISP